MRENIKADLLVWLASLPPSDERLNAVAGIRREDNPNSEETMLSLKELAKLLGYRDTTTLHKLQVQAVGESMGGGRLRYRRSRVENYLKSYQCLELREELRRKRRDREGERKKKQKK
jgi:hypothetical protein